MRKIIYIVMFFLSSTNIFAKDPYEKIASLLSKNVNDIKRIAVIPFISAKSNMISEDGFIVSERLSTEMVNLKKFEVVERNVLYKVLEELKLQQTGIVDQTMAKEIGKILSVDAIITGTIIDIDDKLEINARLIKTDTAKVINATKIKVKKDWVGSSYITQKPQQNLQVGGSYFDFIFGFSSQKMDGRFDFPINGLKEIDDINIKGIGPIGIRWSSIGIRHLGINMEISYQRYITEEKNINNLIVLKDKHFNVGSLGINMDFIFNTFLYRYLLFYFGLGGGFGFNTVKSDYVNDNTGHKLDEFGISFFYRLPIGVRIVRNNVSYFVEARYEGHSISFDRGNVTEDNSLDFKGMRYCFGIGIRY